MKNVLLFARRILLAGGVILHAHTAFGEPKAGEAPPAITLEKVLQAPDGTVVSWEALEDQVVVLEFWATWCGPCIAAIPHLNRLADTFEDRPVQFIAITDENEAKIASFLERKPMRAWIGLDTNRDMFRAYGVRGIPHTVLVGMDGSVDAITHPNSLTEAHIENLLAGRPSGLPRVARKRGDTVPVGEVKDAEGEPPFFQVMIRPSSSGTNWSSSSGTSGTNALGMSYGATMTGHTLARMLPAAYDVHSSRIVVETQLPDGTYDLFLKVPRHRASEADHLRQQAIETTFGLSSRRETREMEAFVLSVKEPDAPGLVPTATPETMSSSSRAGEITGVNIKMDSIVWKLQTGLGKPVVDDTGLSGGFDVELRWEQEDYETPDPSALVDAVREQLGLALTEATLPVEVLIIEGDAPEGDEPLRMKRPVEYATGAFPQSVALADLTGDGTLDVMTANREDDSVTVRLGAGDGSFGDAMVYATDSEPLFVRATDVTGDGIPDLITANYSNSITIFPGRGDGTFGEGRSLSAGEGRLMPINVVVGDFNEDGVPDLASANFMDNSVGLFLGKGDGVFKDPVRIDVGDGPVSIITADLNDDGRADLAVANRRANTATVLLGNGRGEFTDTSYEIGARAGFLAAGDLANNGTADLAVAAYGDNAITLLLGDGDGKFSRRDIRLDGLSPSSLGLADMDNDGWLDIVAVCQGISSVAVLLGGEDAEFSASPQVISVAGPGPDSVALGDLNGDGLADVVTANLGGSISVLESGEGKPGARLAEKVTLTVEFSSAEGESADFEDVTVNVTSRSTSHEAAPPFSTSEKSFTQSFDNLSPGRYTVEVFTGSRERMNDASRPGAFRFEEMVFLDGHSEEQTISVHYEPFAADSLVGNQTAHGRVVDVEGQPLGGMDIRATIETDTAGRLSVATTQTDEDGRFEVANLAEGYRYDIAVGDGGHLGTIAAGEEVTLETPPQVGLAAPDIDFIHLDSGETRRLSDFRGKVVLVDFWASWCGPCQEPMRKMQKYRVENADWGDRVELISLSIDSTEAAAVDHLKKNGWTESYNTWVGEGAFRSKAVQAYDVTGIPSAFLIDQHGKIAAAGHPMGMNIPELIDGLLAREEGR